MGHFLLLVLSGVIGGYIGIFFYRKRLQAHIEALPAVPRREVEAMMRWRKL